VNSYNEFIRWFHQSRIPNLQKFLMNICDDFFFNWQTEKKKIETIRNLSSFPTTQNEYDLHGENIDEFVNNMSNSMRTN
jgi:hypothetical protein